MNESEVRVKKLFLAHYSGDAGEVRRLAAALRLRGIIPWVDKEGGFLIADDSETAARRAIREECFGLLLYATRDVFSRPFIRDVEIDEAYKVYQSDPSFSLFAVPRKIGFADLAEHSQKNFGFDLASFHTVSIGDNADLTNLLGKVATEVLHKRLRDSATIAHSDHVSLQFSTRELMPDEPRDVLRIDATQNFSTSITSTTDWSQLLCALQDVKREISMTYGRPILQVHGSKHLSSAFMFGRVFAPFDLEVRQTRDQVWRSSGYTPSENILSVSKVVSDVENDVLFLEVASRYKSVSDGVDAFWQQVGAPAPYIRLQLHPHSGALNMDERECRAMVQQTYNTLELALQTYPHINEIHMFVAAPQSFMMMLGKEFKGMPQVYLYEWSGYTYVHSYCVPSGVF